MISARMEKRDLAFVSKFANWFLWLGIGLVILGAIAISAATWTTMITVSVLGFFITIASALMLVDTVTFWWGSWGGFFLHLLVGILYLCAGILLIQNPMLGSISITLVLGVAYTIIGIFKMVYVLSTRLIAWRWGFLNALVTLLLGVLILKSWPTSGLYILGLFVGIDLLFVGWTYITLALTTRRALAKRG